MSWMRASLCWSVLLGFLLLFGQAVALAQAPVTPPPTYLVRQWTIEDGLPINTINDLVETPDGFLWLATWDGLVRFDGVRFEVFTASNTDGLVSSRISLLHADRAGNLWVMTEANELVRYRDGVFTAYSARNGMPAPLAGNALPIFRPFAETSDGSFWVGLRAGVSRYLAGKLTPFLPDQITEGVLGITERSDGSVWFVTDGGVVYRVGTDQQVRRYTTQEGVPPSLVYDIKEDGDGVLWIAGEAGVKYLDGDRFVYAAFEGQPITASMVYAHTDPEGRIWFDNRNGLKYLMREGGFQAHVFVEGIDPFEVLFPANPWQGAYDWSMVVHPKVGSPVLFVKDGRVVHQIRPNLPIQAIWRGAGAQLWIATEEGLIQLRPSPFTLWQRPEPTPAGQRTTNVYPIAQDADGVVWVGTLEDNLLRVAGDSVAVWGYWNERFALGHPWTMHLDRSGRFWVGGYAVCQLVPNVNDCWHKGTDAGVREVRALYEDTQGRLWAGGETGVSYRDADGMWHVLTDTPGVTHPWVRAIEETRDGTLWFATNGGGVFRLRPQTSQFEPFSQGEGMCSDFVRAFYEDHQGHLWVATEDQGVCRIANPAAAAVADLTVVSINERQGLFYSGIHAILEDDFGRFWMNTNRGVFWVTREELVAVAEGRAERVHPVVYNEQDGLVNREGNGGVQPAALKDRQGRLWFATQNGAAMIDLVRDTSGLALPPAQIMAVESEGQAVAFRDGVALTGAQREVTVSFTTPSFTKPNGVLFQYRLRGQSDTWFDSGTARSARFTNLSGGTFTFEVRARDLLGSWQAAPTTLTITRTPFFSETLWFYLLWLLVGGVGVWGLVRFRVRQINQRNRELEHRVQERTEALASALETVAEQTEALKSLDAAKSRFFANVSHEFRTPLTLIIGPINSFLAGHYGPLSEHAQAQLDLMLRNSRRLLRLVNQILDLAQLETGNMRLQAERQDLVVFLAGIVEAFRPLAKERGLTLQFEHPPHACWVYVDPQHLEVVVLNLLSNAFKFTPTAGTVGMVIRAEQEQVVVFVSDTGKGIAPEALTHIFDRFYQEEGSQGTGIGLALVRELIDLHGGTIQATSTLGEGTTFTIVLKKGKAHLPADAVGAETLTAQQASAQQPPAQEAWKPSDPPSLLRTPRPDLPLVEAEAEEDTESDQTTVLVVDDNADIRQYLRSVLSATYRVIEAGDGVEGVSVAQAQLPDLIVSDVMMPKQDGFALSRALKADPMTDHIPVILLTAKASKASALEGLETGADDYLVKPFDADELLARIRNQIAARQRLRARFVQQEAVPPGFASTTLLVRAKTVIQERLSDPSFSVQELAEALHLTYATFNRQFRTETDLKPSELIRQMRLEAAAHLLQTHQGSVSEIAYGVGFNNLSYFSRSFRNHFGVLPSEYGS